MAGLQSSQACGYHVDKGFKVLLWLDLNIGGRTTLGVAQRKLSEVRGRPEGEDIIGGFRKSVKL